MRKFSYLFTFFAAVLTLTLNILSTKRPDWLVVHYPEVLRTKITVQYGLTKLCERQLTVIPNPNGGGKLYYDEYNCRPFPTQTADGCDEENKAFCLSWTTAGYAAQIAIGFSALSLATILFGVSTHSRRRRIWKAVAGLVMLHAIFQIVSFGIITDLYRTSKLPAFEQARLGTGYVLNLLSWIFDVLIVIAVITTGLAADRGYQWAAGNRAYQPIDN